MNTPLPFERPVYVSRPALPPLTDYIRRLESIWASNILTNMGPMHEMLELAVGERIGSGRVSLWNNGMSALIAAVSSLQLERRKIAVTPFTFPATVHAISLLGLEPVFVDIDDTLTLDPVKLEEAVDSEVGAVMGTHVYGRFCDTAAIDAIARRNDLRVIYDGAHIFGRSAPVIGGEPHRLGDITMLSFHATKLFHSVEGGALITADQDVDRRLRLIRNFGIVNENDVKGLGLNGKMSEVHAAMGLSMLDLIDAEIDQRLAVANRYLEALEGIPGIRVVSGADGIVQYFVLRVDAEEFGSTRDDLHTTLRSLNVISRKYFSPLCSDFEPYNELPSAKHLPVARKAAQEVIALPLYGGLSLEDADRIADIVRWHQKGGVL
ncbi:DegT/DnrJ/EryC1/StrS family aminotransferase [Leifsonia shinshuensis]|uniref:DegT/DnrJ/EryC1/StrS family aminotransferase n=1 Tax=Leifsonia shinshuensis TaxID=150026 RepID=UPI00285F3041|nr:DegT/DnrJ/EryC1/StrS family aminotransferase [Leifsonia shinshuensis]MDR6971589.1 dTDP-4-amino-4,6-dideoxygalactose transaminase [Leifsonia shinshuensis]